MTSAWAVPAHPSDQQYQLEHQTTHPPSGVPPPDTCRSREEHLREWATERGQCPVSFAICLT